MNQDLARKLVYERSGHACERCDRARAIHWHHRLNRSQGGLWTPSNGLHICADCHGFIGGRRTEARVNGWAVLPGIDPATVAVLIGNGSRWVYLDDLGAYVNNPPEVLACVS